MNTGVNFMNEDEFWNLIESAKKSSSNVEGRPGRLKVILGKLSTENVRIFDELYFDQIIDSYRWDLWGAAYVINGGGSDDGFKYFCDFLISEGRETFKAAIKNPESLAVLNDLEDSELEEFSYIASEVYEEKAGSELPSYSKSYPKEPIGEPWDEDLENGETEKGYSLHNLYQTKDAANRSELVMNYPADFFWSAKSLKAGIIIPNRALQLRLIELIASGEAATLHEPRYSAISNPFDKRYQNCTEYVLDVLNAAIYQTVNRDQLKANAKAYFSPTVIQKSPFKIALGSLFLKEITKKDHRGPVATATFTSIGQYLVENNLVKVAVVLGASGEVRSLL